MFRAWAFRSVQLWVIANFVGNMGAWMMRIGQDWLVLTDLTDNSGVALGVVSALQFLPTLLIGPLAGAIVDRFSPRTILFLTQGTQALLALTLGVLVVTGVTELWHVYGLALLLGCVSAFDGPARQVFVASLVPLNTLSSAVSLNSSSFNAAQLVGPGVAGLLIAATGSTAELFFINAISFTALILALVVIRPIPTAQDKSAEKTGLNESGVRAGLRYLRTRRDLGLILMIVLTVAIFGFEYNITSALMARVEFGLDASGYGAFAALMGAGSIVGTLFAARVASPRISSILIAASWFGVLALAQSLAPNPVVFGAFCPVVGFFALRMLTMSNTSLQLRSEPKYRGRIMALYVMVLMGSIPIGSPTIGWLGEHLGPRWAIAIGAASALISVVVILLWAALWWGLRYRVRFSPWPQVTAYRPDSL